MRRAQDGDDGVPTALRGLEGDRAVADHAWSMFGSIAAGILLYGGIGWLLDRWLGFDSLLMPIGVLIGAGLGITLVFVRSNRTVPTPPATSAPTGDSGPRADGS